MSEGEGLVSAYLLDGTGSGRQLDWTGVEQWSPDDGLLWVHLDYTAPRVQAWFRHHSGVDEIASEALLVEETRPRSTALGNGLLLTLRGVNLNPGADPEDMVSIRVWTDGRRIISTRNRRLLSVDDLRRDLHRGKGPATVGQFIVQLADHLIERMADVVGGIDETVDGLEDQVLTMQSYQHHGVSAPRVSHRTAGHQRRGHSRRQRQARLRGGDRRADRSADGPALAAQAAEVVLIPGAIPWRGGGAATTRRAACVRPSAWCAGPAGPCGC